MNRMSTKAAVNRLLNDLEMIAADHEELTDTEVREAMHRILNHYFVWGASPERFPRQFAMFSAEADVRLGEVLRTFVDDARRCAETEKLERGPARLAALQDNTLTTDGGQSYDDFLGHADTPIPNGPLPGDWFETRDQGDTQD